MFERAYERFLKKQREAASGRRLEMLDTDLTGTKKLLEVVVWPVLHSFEGIVLEHEVRCWSGVAMFIDAFYAPLSIAFECEGFASHAETITRGRFDFEKTRVRTMATQGIIPMPFSKDQLDRQPELCRQSVYELLGRYTSAKGSKAMLELSVLEREVVRYALTLDRPLRLEDVKTCLDCKFQRAHNVVWMLMEKKILIPGKESMKRNHHFTLSPTAHEYILAGNK